MCLNDSACFAFCLKSEGYCGSSVRLYDSAQPTQSSLSEISRAEREEMTNTKPTQPTQLTTDYLIVGAGALGLGFLEELILNSSNLQAVIVDKRDKPGGHWNDAYSFVRLHQPACTYGVNSRSLGVGGPDLASK